MDESKRYAPEDGRQIGPKPRRSRSAEPARPRRKAGGTVEVRRPHKAAIVPHSVRRLAERAAEASAEAAKVRAGVLKRAQAELAKLPASEKEAVARALARVEEARNPLSERIIAFIENLRVPSGVGQGEHLRLREWQRDLIRCTFDPLNDDGTRRIRRSLWSVARKNGKTAIIAALLLCALVGPLAQPNGEVYSAATDRAQAAIVFKMARQMVELDDELRNMCGIFDSSKRIVCYHLGSFYQALSADAHRQHGQNPHFVIYDELAQAPNRELYDVLSTSFGAQANGMLIVISTQSSDPTSIMYELSDDAIAQEQGLLDDPYFFGVVFRLEIEPDDPRVWDETFWHEANPALGDFKLMADMRAKAHKAKRSPDAAVAFKQLDLNMRVDGTAAFLNSEDWRACQGEISDEALIASGVRPAAGLDLSGRRDLSALVLLWDLGDRIACRAWFWTPTDQLEKRSKADGANYPQWVKDGILKAIPGRMMDYGVIAEDIIEIHQRFNIAELAFDDWRFEDLRKELDARGMTEDKLYCSKFRQGFKTFTVAIDDLEKLVLEHQLLHDGNKALTYCLGNVRVLRDAALNRKFDKRQKNKRIDGAVALAQACKALFRPDDKEETGPSVYEERGLLAF